ncbi:MAG TPA: hypothetical protein VFR49_12960, partial [Solirubrobacteraceae bacterium]|nr:hypothetical protein [Solirubrobacteraceae bacterium]
MSEIEQGRPASTQAARLERRAAARRRQLRSRRRAGAGFLGVLLVVVAAVLIGGRGGRGKVAAPRGASATGPSAIRPGGPLAPAALGGLAALWAP